MYSALKHQGERLYRLARQGIEVERPPRRVTIHRLDLLQFGPDWLDFEVVCSKGTYVRSLAEDFARASGTVGHVASLRRTELGPFRNPVLRTLEDIEQAAEHPEALDAMLLPADAALLKMEVAGICGTDVRLYQEPPTNKPTIMGHENIGTIAKCGAEFTRRKGFKEGDLVFLEHYVMCGKCEWCHQGQYRHCENTDWRTNPEGIRYGYTSAEKAPHLWGGFAQYLYLPWNAVVHPVPKGVSAELAGLVTPMANGVGWSLFDGGVGYDSTVLIQGPGQQGLSQTVICKQAGASLIIVTGTAKDRKRLETARELGADYAIDVNAEDPLARIREITGGKGVDVVLDCTAGAGTIPILLGIEALKRKGGTMVVQGELKEFPNFPLERVTVKFITIKSARGHSYRACELALAQLASKRFPLDKVTTHRFGLKDVDLAIRAVGGQGVPDVIHASLMPWL